MVLFTLNVKKIKGAAHEYSNVDIVCKRAFYRAIYKAAGFTWCNSCGTENCPQSMNGSLNGPMVL